MNGGSKSSPGRPPLSLVNYLGMQEYFGISANIAGGFSLCDGESGEYWSPSWQPPNPLHTDGHRRVRPTDPPSRPGEREVMTVVQGGRAAHCAFKDRVHETLSKPPRPPFLTGRELERVCEFSPET